LDNHQWYLIINLGKPAKDVLDADWVKNTFTTNVKLRGQQIIDARGTSSAASAANAAINHMRSWFQGHNGWISFGVDSTGNPYGVPEGVFYSFPVEVNNGKWSIVKGLQLNAQQKEAMKKTADELTEERAAIQDMLK
jgi:malate dehydrogenase